MVFSDVTSFSLVFFSLVQCRKNVESLALESMKLTLEAMAVIQTAVIPPDSCLITWMTLSESLRSTQESSSLISRHYWMFYAMVDRLVPKPSELLLKNGLTIFIQTHKLTGMC